MKVANDCVVTLEYEIRTMKGDVIEASKARGAPLQFICGKGAFLPGLEKRLHGAEAGTEKEFEIPPEEAFGPKDSGPEGSMKKGEFPPGTKLEKGVRFEANLPGGGGSVQILVVDPATDPIKVRYVHPLAGQSLKVKCKVLGVRAAKPDELRAGVPS